MTEAEMRALRNHIEKCAQLFAAIRGDWTDPREECREGRKECMGALGYIDAALAAGPQTDPRDALLRECEEAIRGNLACCGGSHVRPLLAKLAALAAPAAGEEKSNG